MKVKWKRLLTLVLTLAMVLSWMSTGAWAAEPENGQTKAVAEAGETDEPTQAGNPAEDEAPSGEELPDAVAEESVSAEAMMEVEIPLTARMTGLENGNTYVVNENVTLDSRISVNGTVTLNLNENCVLTAPNRHRDLRA